MLELFILSFCLTFAFGQLNITLTEFSNVARINCSSNFEWNTCVIGSGTVKNQRNICRHNADSNSYCNSHLLLTDYAEPQNGWCSIRKAGFDKKTDFQWFCEMTDKTGTKFQMEVGNHGCNISTSILMLAFAFISLKQYWNTIQRILKNGFFSRKW